PGAAAKGGQARAPAEGQTRVRRDDGQELPDLVPRKSRSFWYYAVAPAAPALRDPPPGARLQFLVNRTGAEEYESHCVTALRTPRPLFHFLEPAAGTAYTPRDAIPFAVEFTPYAVPGRRGKGKVVPFQAEDFEVHVTLTPAQPDVKAAGQPKPFRL